jgi:hypothetical protein
MLHSLQTYLKNIFQSFDWNQASFQSLQDIKDLKIADFGISPFHFFFLTKLIQDNERNGCHIQLPAKHCLNDLYVPTLLSAVLSHYNLSLSADDMPEMQFRIGDVIYSRGLKDFLQFCGGREVLYFKRVLTKGQEEEYIEIRKEDLHRYPVLPSTDDFAYNRNSVHKLEEFFDFFQSHLTSFDPLFHFSKKCLLIASSEVAKCLSQLFLPIRYNGNKYYQVPVEPLVEIVNDYDTASKLIENGQAFYSVIVLGGSRYKHTLDRIKDNFDEGLFQKLITIGEAEVSDSFGFKRWHWTQPEWRIFHGLDPRPAIPLSVLTDPSLERFRDRFDNLKNAFSDFGVDNLALDEMGKRLVQYFSRLIVPVELCQVKEFVHKQFFETHWLESYFKDANLDDEFPLFCSELEKLLDEFLETFENQKLNFLLSHYTPEGDLFLVTEKWQADILNPLLEEGRKFSYRAISLGELARQLRQELPSKSKFKKTHFIFSYLYYTPFQPVYYLEMFRRAADFGNTTLLCYKGIDTNRVEVLNALTERWNCKWWGHTDRNWFVPFSFEQDLDTFENQTEIADEVVAHLDELQSLEKNDIEIGLSHLEKIRDYFSHRFGMVDDFSAPGSKYDLKKIRTEFDENDQNEDTNGQMRKWKVLFSDGTESEFPEDMVIAKKEGGGKFTGVPISNLQPGDIIAANFSITFDNSFESLKTIPDLKEYIKEIKWASKEWRSWLKWMLETYLSKHSNNRVLALKELNQKLEVNVSSSTVNVWLETKEEYLFPREISDLEKILDLRVRKTPPAQKDEILASKERIRRSRDISASFREVMTKLSHELSTYLATGEKGSYLSNIPAKHIERMLQYKELKTIKTVVPSDEPTT